MKKLNKLFAILIAVLGVQTLSAQTWTAPVIGQDLKDVNNSTELYMYNVKADAFACSGMSWGTHATVKELQNGDTKLSADVHRCRVSKPTDGQLQIMLNERTWLGGKLSNTNDCWVDYGSNNVYIYSEVSDNVYTLKPTTATNESYLDCAWAYGGHITFSATNGYGNTEWAFVLRSDITNGKYLLYKAKKEMYDIYTALKAAGHDGTYATALSTANKAYTASNATAATVNAATKTLLVTVAPALSSKYFAANSLFNNPDMRGFGDDTDWGNGLNDFANGIFESWHSAETITQTQTGLPNGFYTVVFLGMYRQDGGDAAPTLTLTSGNKSAKANLKSLAEIDFGVIEGAGKLNDWTENWVSNKPNSTYSAGEALAHTDAGVKVENFVVENGELTITVAMPSTSQWLLCQGFEIYYKAESLDEYANLFYAAKSSAEAFNTEELNAAAASKLTTALSAAATEQMDKEWYQARTAELNAAVALANEVKVPYANFKSLIASCETIVSNSQETTSGAKATFTTATNTAKESVENATTADAINVIYNTLETARQTYVGVAEPLNGIKFDYTFMIVNPKFDEGTNGWAFNTGASNNGIATNQGGAITGNYFENWKWESYTGEIYQELTGLPSGKYILTAAAFRDQLITDATDGDAVYVFANDTETLVNSGTPAFYSVEVSITAGTLRFGVKSKVEKYRWMGIDNVSLEYVEGLGLTEFINAYEAALAAATAARDNNEYRNVAGAEKTALLAAIALQPEQTQASYESTIAALQSATATFIAAKNSYDLLDTEKQTAKGLGMSDALIAETIADKTGLAALQDLKETEYVYVTEEFNYPVELEASGWIPEGPVGSMTSQHYDGTSESSYLEQSSSAWGSDAWEISYKYEKTLPAGKYVFKVAGRRAAGAGNTMDLTVTNVNNSDVLGSVNDFPEGDIGLGINKAGATSFDADDAVGFANDGAGRGWQWRYVMFELDSETTVQVAVNAAATTKYQWMSFCGASLQMTEETYLEANKHGLDAPTAVAQALVNAVPMGSEEIEALQQALDMTYTTGAELLAKIEALNAAAANAEAWVPKYNEAKAPLVAALERFEADYNDAQNGSLDYMNKSHWATAISMAQAAAEAKDVTDSYAGFAEATENLVAALDAATISVEEYAALNAAIKTAKPLYEGGNWGDQPFQRPVSVKESLNTTTAQATYDAAEADGEAVTSVTDALNENVEAVDAIVLNAPAEGTRYNMVMYYADWEHHNKAVTYIANDRADHGLYNIKYHSAPNTNYAQAFTFTAVEGKANCYTLSMTDVDGNERYVCTGSVYGGNADQLRTTTEADKALAVKVIATATDGIHQLYNTEANNYIGGQDAGFYTVNSHTTFRLQEAAKANVTLTIPEERWTTLILPFDAELPENVKAYSCSEVKNNVLTLVEAESLKANTPYLVNGYENDYDFSGYGLADKDCYTDGLFTGTYVEYHTTANSNTYVLQNVNSELGFYLVDENEQPAVDAYCCYITYEAQGGEEQASMFLLSGGQGDDPTAIEGTGHKAQGAVLVYDLMGRKVTTMEKGKFYIVNGVKVIIK